MSDYFAYPVPHLDYRIWLDHVWKLCVHCIKSGECFIQSLLFFFSLLVCGRYTSIALVSSLLRRSVDTKFGLKTPANRSVDKTVQKSLRWDWSRSRPDLHSMVVLKGLVNCKFNKGSTRVLDHQLTKNYSQQYNSSTPTQVFKVPPSSNCGKVQYGSYSELESVI